MKKFILFCMLIFTGCCKCPKISYTEDHGEVIDKRISHRTHVIRINGHTQPRITKHYFLTTKDGVEHKVRYQDYDTTKIGDHYISKEYKRIHKENCSFNKNRP